MNIKFRTKRYTFLVVPEVGKSVFSFRVPRMALVIIPIVIVTMIAALYFLYRLNNEHLAAISSLENKLSLNEMSMTDMVLDKNNEILKQRSEISSLSQQAEQVEKKLEELRKLEEELRSLSGKEVSQAKDQVNIASSASTQEPVTEDDLFELESHMGGILYPPRESEIDQLVSSTETHFTQLDIQTVELLASLTVAKEELVAYQEQLRITPSIWPVTSRQISSPFGYRKDPFTGNSSFHSGIDIASNFGSTVKATADGVVVYVGFDDGHGNNVIIDHSNGLRTRYMHLSKYTVKLWQKVSKGDKIGEVGSTGRSTGSHLHYEVIKNGKQVDPNPYLNFSGKDEN